MTNKPLSVGDILSIPSQQPRRSEKGAQLDSLKRETENLKKIQEQHAPISPIIIKKSPTIKYADLTSQILQPKDKGADVISLESQIKELRFEVNRLRSTTIPVSDARALTYKALKKGRALQFLSYLVSNNSLSSQMMRDGFTTLTENCYGVAYGAYRRRFGESPGLQAHAEDQLRLFRQEQLFLIAENERLSQQVKQLKDDLRSGMEIRAELQMNKQENRVPAYSDLESDVVGNEGTGEVEIATPVVLKALNSLSSCYQIARLRTMASAFRSVGMNLAFHSGSDSALGKWEVIKTETEKKGFEIMAFLFKKKQVGALACAFWKTCFSFSFPQRHTYGKPKPANVPQFFDIPPHLREPLSYNRITASTPNEGQRLALSSTGWYPNTLQMPPGRPSEFICQPYHYGTLPSMRKRNHYFAANPVSSTKPLRILTGLLGEQDDSLSCRPVGGYGGWSQTTPCERPQAAGDLSLPLNINSSNRDKLRRAQEEVDNLLAMKPQNEETAEAYIGLLMEAISQPSSAAKEDG